MGVKFLALCALLAIVFISETMVSSTTTTCQAGEKTLCLEKYPVSDCKCVNKRSRCDPEEYDCGDGNKPKSCTDTLHACFCYC
uniref:Hypothetical secreted peptide n=1 Tax=Hyalomma rufipes TaxID=72862 RepID=E2J6T6_HYARU